MPMKLLLKEDVRGLGEVGDVVTVADGYGRNFLLPRCLAVELNTSNLQFIEGEKKRRVARAEERVKNLRLVSERIAATDVTIAERVHNDDALYGAIQAKEVVDALAEEGIPVDPEMIHFPEPIKKLGVHTVEVRLHPDVTAELKVWVVEKKNLDAL